MPTSWSRARTRAERIRTEFFPRLISTFRQESEFDELWEKLSDGGEKGRCGWLKDKYGLSWQVIPSILGKLLQGKDAEKSQRVMKAMLQMDKFDVERLMRA